MALINPGPIASDIRGSMGGSVFSRNRSGLYIRRRVVPVNPATPAQTQARDRVSELQAAFRDVLTATQRALWEALAQQTSAKNKIGLGITLTPQNLYIKINSLVLLAGATRIDDPPIPPAGTDTPTLTWAATTALGVQITAVSPDGPTDAILYAQSSPALNTTVNFYKGPWQSSASDIAAVDAFNVPIQLVPAAGVAIGQRYHVRARYLDPTGRVSNYVTQVLDVVA